MGHYHAMAVVRKRKKWTVQENIVGVLQSKSAKTIRL